MTGMDFGSALKGLKQGFKLARTGWNAGGQYVYLVGEGRYPATTDTGREIAAGEDDDRVPYRPYLALKTVQGDVVPWEPTVSDCLAEDWELV